MVKPSDHRLSGCAPLLEYIKLRHPRGDLVCDVASVNHALRAQHGCFLGQAHQPHRSEVGATRPRTSHSSTGDDKGKYYNYLRVSNHTDDLAVTQHLTEIVLDALLAEIIGPLLAGLGECLLLALVPD